MASQQKFRKNHLQRGIDGIVVFVGWFAVLVISDITEVVIRSTLNSFVLTLGGTIATLVVMDWRGLYVDRPAVPRTEEIARVFIATAVGTASVAVLAASLDWNIGVRELLIGGSLVFSGRTLARGFLRALAEDLPGFRRSQPIVIIGAGEEARELAELVMDHPESKFDLRGVIGNLSVAERSGLDGYWLGPTSRLIELMHQHEATGAVVTATGFRGQQFRNLTRELFDAEYDVHLTTGVSRMWEGRFEVRSLTHEPLIFMSNNRVANWQRRLKRLIDIAGAISILIVAAPVMAAAAAAIWLDDRGALTYSSQRVGVNGQNFSMYKFRSMVADAEKLKKQLEADNERNGPLFKLSKDPRITRVGRIIRETSIDELPQLWNVVKGDMSLVGPRPALPEEQKVFDAELRDRVAVRPGITGLWQVEARSNAAFNAYRRLDLHYVENWSLSLDVRILLATVDQVLIALALFPLRRILRSGANPDGIVNGATSSQDTRRPALTAAVAPADVVVDLREHSRERLTSELKTQRSEVRVDLTTTDEPALQSKNPATSNQSAPSFS